MIQTRLLIACALLGACGTATVAGDAGVLTDSNPDALVVVDASPDASADASLGDAPLDGAVLDARDDGSLEARCVAQGGFVFTSWCCKGNKPFPDICSTNCTCAPTANADKVLMCDCGRDNCWDGTGCRPHK